MPRPVLTVPVALCSVVCLASLLSAQQPAPPPAVQNARPLKLPTLRPPVADTGVFSPLAWAPGNNRRAADGSPGPEYWQQRVDYQIKASLDTAAKRITGTESIAYTNNSADSLRFIWMQLDQNLFRPGSTGSLLFPSESRFGSGGFQGGFEIDSVFQCGSPEKPTASKTTRTSRKSRRNAPAPALPRCGTAQLKTRVDDTMMYVELSTPVPPKGTTRFDLTYSFNIPEHGADRMGRDGSLYEIAQWYPRLAVYDDVHGWNTDQYLGQGEFYLEYGTIDYEVTVPAGYIVAGSGVLQNPGDVLTTAQRERLAQAARSDTTVAIVTQADLSSGVARPTSDGALTWRFRRAAPTAGRCR